MGSDEQTGCDSCQTAECSAQKKLSDESSEEFKERQALQSKLCRIKHKLVVLSGKGGVGKSTVAANLALSLAAQGRRTGLLDVDIHGPSIPRMLGLEGYPIESYQNQLVPVPLGDALKVMSIGFLLRGTDEAVIWRGPLKMGVIKQFLRDVDWGELDYLVIDSPPGTGDEPLSVIQLIEDLDGAVIVTTPQDISIIDVRRSIQFCRAVHTPVLGVIENMSGFVCPHCGKTTDIFKSGGGEKMAHDMNVPFLGRIPLDPQIAQVCDQGTPYLSAFMQSESAKAFSNALEKLIASVEGQEPSKSEAVDMDSVQDRRDEKTMEGKIMKIALPVADGKLCMHFGHCQFFALVEVDQDQKVILNTKMLTPPAHAPGVLPPWVAEQGASYVITGGMGGRAVQLFEQAGVKVITGAPAEPPEKLVMAFLNGTLQTGDNVCDHGPDHIPGSCNH